jgi:hypothetical protein
MSVGVQFKLFSFSEKNLQSYFLFLFFFSSRKKNLFFNIFFVSAETGTDLVRRRTFAVSDAVAAALPVWTLEQVD